MTVKECKRLKAALGDGGHLSITQDGLNHHISECSALQVLHHDPQLMTVLHQETVDVVDQVTVLQLPHHLDTRRRKLHCRALLLYYRASYALAVYAMVVLSLIHI